MKARVATLPGSAAAAVVAVGGNGVGSDEAGEGAVDALLALDKHLSRSTSALATPPVRVRADIIGHARINM